jgi:hypothetical protein
MKGQTVVQNMLCLPLFIIHGTEKFTAMQKLQSGRQWWSLIQETRILKAYEANKCLGNCKQIAVLHTHIQI